MKSKFGEINRKIVIYSTGSVMILILLILIYYFILKKTFLINKSSLVSSLIQLKDLSYAIIGTDNKIYTSINLKTLTPLKTPPLGVPTMLYQSQETSLISCVMKDGSVYSSPNFITWTKSPSTSNVKFITQLFCKTSNSICYFIIININNMSTVFWSSQDITNPKWNEFSTFYTGQGSINNIINANSIYYLNLQDGSSPFYAVVDILGNAFVTRKVSAGINGWQMVQGNTPVISQFVMYNTLTYAVSLDGRIIYTKGDSLYGPPTWKQSKISTIIPKQLVILQDNKALLVSITGNIYKIKI